MIYNITEARKQFEKLVDLALAGEEVILARRKTPMVRLEPIRSPKAASRQKSASGTKRANKKTRLG